MMGTHTYNDTMKLNLLLKMLAAELPCIFRVENEQKS